MGLRETKLSSFLGVPQAFSNLKNSIILGSVFISLTRFHYCHLEGKATKALKSSKTPAPSVENGNNSPVPLLCCVHITAVRSHTRLRLFDVIKELVQDGLETASHHLAKSWSHPCPSKGFVPPGTW